MRIVLKFLVVLTFFSCNNRTKTDAKKQDGLSNESEVYKSSHDSFRKGFFMKIKEKNAIIYGWTINDKKDTIYYRSVSEFEVGKDGQMGIRLEKYELSKIRPTEENLNCFKNDTELNLPELSAYSSFSGKLLSNNSYEFKAVKHNYFGRYDEFKFLRVK